MTTMNRVEDSQSSFLGRCESTQNPIYLSETQFLWGVNVTARGGLLRERPGNATVFNLPCGNPQGMTVFTPTGGNPHIVAAVSGRIYVSSAPFTQYRRLKNVRFYDKALFVSFADCLQTVDYDEAGVIDFLPTPKRVLVMQDGFGRAA